MVSPLEKAYQHSTQLRDRRSSPEETKSLHGVRVQHRHRVVITGALIDHQSVGPIDRSAQIPLSLLSDWMNARSLLPQDGGSGRVFRFDLSMDQRSATRADICAGQMMEGGRTLEGSSAMMDGSFRELLDCLPIGL